MLWVKKLSKKPCSITCNTIVSPIQFKDAWKLFVIKRPSWNEIVITVTKISNDSLFPSHISRDFMQKVLKDYTKMCTALWKTNQCTFKLLNMHCRLKLKSHEKNNLKRLVFTKYTISRKNSTFLNPFPYKHTKPPILFNSVARLVYDLIEIFANKEWILWDYWPTEKN